MIDHHIRFKKKLELGSVGYLCLKNDLKRLVEYQSHCQLIFSAGRLINCFSFILSPKTKAIHGFLFIL